MRSVMRLLRQRETSAALHRLPNVKFLSGLGPAVKFRRTSSTARTNPPLLRFASTATLTAPDTFEILPTPLDRPLAVPVAGARSVEHTLREIRTLLAEEIGGADDWLRRVDLAIEDLSETRRGRMAVYGESLASPADVVSALLQDPLVDTRESRRLLLQRGALLNGEALQIGYGDTGDKLGAGLAIPSSFLQTSTYDILEVRSVEKERALTDLLSADIAILVLDPYRLLSTSQLSSLLPTLVSLNTPLHIVVNGPLPPRISESDLEATVLKELKELRGKDSHQNVPPQISFVQADKALHALEALAAGLEHTASNQSRAFDIFQTDFLYSQIGILQSQLLSATSANPAPQLSTSINLIHLALDYISETISADRQATRQATHTVSELRHQAAQASRRARHLSVVNRGIQSGVVEGGVEQEMEETKKDLAVGFRGRWNWLNLVGKLRVDDVGGEVGGYIERSFGRGLEKQVVFETGQLSQIQVALSTKADTTIRQLSATPHRTNKTSTAPHPFSSPLLLNHLSTLSLSVPPLDSTSLLSPIRIRRKQILDYSIPYLQRSANHALLSTYALAASGAGLGWAGCMLLEIWTGYAGFAVGLGGVVGGLALGQRLWDKGVKKFWRDWKRLGGMLKGDLQAQFEAAVDTQVLAKPQAAADGLEKLVMKRESRLDQLQEEVDRLRRSL